MVDLRTRREECGYSQTRLAMECGVRRQTIGEIECGRNEPSVKLAQKIGDVLKFDWWLLYPKKISD